MKKARTHLEILEEKKIALEKSIDQISEQVSQVNTNLIANRGALQLVEKMIEEAEEEPKKEK